MFSIRKSVTLSRINAGLHETLIVSFDTCCTLCRQIEPPTCCVALNYGSNEPSHLFYILTWHCFTAFPKQHVNDSTLLATFTDRAIRYQMFLTPSVNLPVGLPALKQHQSSSLHKEILQSRIVFATWQRKSRSHQRQRAAMRGNDAAESTNPTRLQHAVLPSSLE